MSSAATPLESYQAALNYNSINSKENTNDKNDVTSFKRIISKINNSNYIYPTISIVLFTISNLFIVITKSISLIYKCVAILFLLIYIAFTIYWFKK